MKIHECSCSFVFEVFNNLNGTRVHVRSCSMFSKKWVFDDLWFFQARVRSCSIIFEKSVFVQVRANTNEHQCSLYTCSCSFIPDQAHIDSLKAEIAAIDCRPIVRGVVLKGVPSSEKAPVRLRPGTPIRDERTRTRIERTLVFVRVRPNMNEHEHGFFKKYWTRTNTNSESSEIIEHERTRTLNLKSERTPNTWQNTNTWPNTWSKIEHVTKPQTWRVIRVHQTGVPRVWRPEKRNCTHLSSFRLC